MAIDLTNFKALPPDYQGWNGNHEIFMKLVNETKPNIIVEIGSWKGQSTLSLARACVDKGLNTQIYCIDTWLGALEFYTCPTPDRDLMLKNGYPQVYYQFISNMFHAGVASMINPIPLPSALGIQLVPDADLIYIDASHEYDDVKLDVKNALAKSPIVFGDDYGNKAFPGVKKAIDEHKNVEIVDGWFWIIRN